MVWDPNLWTLPLLLGGVLTGVLFWVTRSYRSSPGLSTLSLFLAATTVWILAYLGEILAQDTSTMIWFARVEYLGIAFVGPTWLAFALTYTGRSYMITRRRVLAVSVLSAITVVMAWTSSWHGLLWRSVDVRSTAAGSALATRYGPWFWVNTGFQYGCLALATLLLLWGLARKSSPLRGQGIILALATLAPWLGNIAYVSGWAGAEGIDLSVYGLAAAGVVFAWGLLAGTLMEIVPVARDRVVETSGDAVLVMDRGGWIVDANPAARELLQGAVPLLRSRAREALAHHDLDPETLPVGRSLLDLRVGAPPRTRIFDCQVSELGQPGAPSQGRVAALRDVTEAELHRRALEDGREAMEARLRQAQKMETVGTLAGGIAHDFNNILAAIRGFTELAASDLPPHSPARSDLEQVLQATDRARNLVRQILTFSRKTAEQRSQVRLNEVLEEAMAFIRASLPSTIQLQTHLDPELPEVFADGTQMYQVLLNLCSNAADAMEGMAEGALAITLDRAIPEPGRLPDDLAHEAKGGWVRVRVRDNGPGMDAETRARVFDPFFTTKEVGRGTGLGMAVVHGIVASHGGWIDLASRPGKGTEVTVWIPATRGGQSEFALAAPVRSGRVSAKRILVVDDEESVLTLTRRFLESLGHEVRYAETPARAREILAADPGWPELMLTDQTMPGATGLDLVSMIREGGCTIPVIVMTGLGNSLPRERMEEVSVALILPKPFTRGELDAALGTVFPEA